MKTTIQGNLFGDVYYERTFANYTEIVESNEEKATKFNKKYPRKNYQITWDSYNNEYYVWDEKTSHPLFLQ